MNRRGFLKSILLGLFGSFLKLDLINPYHPEEYRLIVRSIDKSIPPSAWENFYADGKWIMVRVECDVEEI